ncbi:LysR family transcriptional regulator [Alicyclobacillus fodiniaquatilis]|uniref:LysR family transcriptional regulator n=1 Tax=Alicyclobacillus fodiniaquatilis TaxID=1661150 RepID=A0ABW4JBT2_9BACL
MNAQLMTFVVVAEQRNFTRAAELLHATQPAISQQIQTLETRLGTKLLERSNKQVQLNRAGEIVYEYAKQMIQLYGQMERLVADLTNSASGTLHIGASFTYGEYVLPQILADFVATYPNITPSISINNTREVVEQVGAGHLDMGVIEGGHINPHVMVKDLAEDTMVIVAAAEHPLSANRGAFNQAALERETWLLREQGSGTREIADQMFEALDIHPTAIIEIGSTQAIKESVEAGLGIAVLSESVIRKEISLGTLTTLPALAAPFHRKFSTVLRKTSFHTRATQLFFDFLYERASTQS